MEYLSVVRRGGGGLRPGSSIAYPLFLPQSDIRSALGGRGADIAVHWHHAEALV